MEKESVASGVVLLGIRFHRDGLFLISTNQIHKRRVSPNRISYVLDDSDGSMALRAERKIHVRSRKQSIEFISERSGEQPRHKARARNWPSVFRFGARHSSHIPTPHRQHSIDPFDSRVRVHQGYSGEQCCAGGEVLVPASGAERP